MVMAATDFVLGPPVQIAYAVPDAEAAARWWVEATGAGPFFLAPHIEVHDVVHRGRDATFDHTSAYGQWGSVMVELVQDHTPGPSVVADLYPDGGSGVHHLAYFVDDVVAATAALDELGMALAMSAWAGPTRFHFVDAVARLGHFIELYEPNPALVGFYERVETAAQGWDGADPVRMR